MFRSASQIDSERTASSLRRIKANWERTADSWFTGSVDSIDRRIDLCERLIHQASQATARLLDRPESAHYMKLANDLQADHEALTQMRRDLLTAAFDRDPAIRSAALDGWRSSDAYDDDDDLPEPPMQGDGDNRSSEEIEQESKNWCQSCGRRLPNHERGCKRRKAARDNSWLVNLSKSELADLIGYPGEETDEQLEDYERLFGDDHRG